MAATEKTYNFGGRTISRYTETSAANTALTMSVPASTGRLLKPLLVTARYSAGTGTVVGKLNSGVD